MDFDRLKKEIKEIVEIVSAVPESFQTQCFEILLNRLLDEDKRVVSIPLHKETLSATAPLLLSTAPDDLTTSSSPVKPTQAISSNKIPVNNHLTVFMRKRKILTEDLEKILLFTSLADGKGEVHFLEEPNPVNTPVSVAQIQWAMLLALKNCIEKSDEFIVDYDNVREMCKSKGVFDTSNFASYFKKNKKYFKEVPTSQSQRQTLSDDGEIYLASVIKSLASQAK